MMIKNYTKYIKESHESEYNINDVNVGDMVIITDKLLLWISEYYWDSQMIKAVGKIAKVSHIEDYSRYKTCRVDLVSDKANIDEWWFPIQCLVPLGERKNIRSIKWYNKGKFEKEI
jgi:hypothetical protein